METMGNTLALFVKPWKQMSIPDLARHVRMLGFEWIELPVRPGFPCTPETVERCLPEAVRVLAEEGVHVLNITAELPLDDERLYAASQQAGVALNRVMFSRAQGENYWAAEARARRALDAAQPLCERYGCQVGVQNHSGPNVPNHAMGLHVLLQDYDPRYIGAIWDPAHNALEGEDSDPALDIVQDHLMIVNLKNAFWRQVDGPPDAPAAVWQVYWCAGSEGLASWPRVITRLKAMNYQGPLCFSAEYTDAGQVDRMIVKDLHFAQELMDVRA